MAESLPSTGASGGPSLHQEEQAFMRGIADASAFDVRPAPGSPQVDPYAAALRLAITQAELSDRLRVALQNAASKSGDSMKALRIAVCEFTVALRDQGTTPEAVLIKLKAVINAHAFPPTWQVSRWSGPRLRDSISTWCIEEYFKEKTA